ncbi:MarC family protein [Sulfurihydrogenibium azorense]|uniref:MarC family protein n=1 Tax=Sulfurihydrogenibium azorense TaxID=309806 RepID=UPI00240A504A|nr:MarC family protein [Sulfurihydrogenibium azorense]MDM7273294.1 MarC family protein [Sulfurihydrogenibium azorense]
MDVLYLILKYTISIFAIVDPFGAIPLIISVLKNFSDKEREFIIKKASLYGCFILIFFLFLGNFFVGILGVSIADFQIAGGIILLLISINIIFGQPLKEKISPEEIPLIKKLENIALIPVATPILAGPGAMVTAMTVASSQESLLNLLIVAISIVITFLISYFILKASKYIQKLLGEIFLDIVSRMMGIVIMALAVQFIVKGIKQNFFPILH